MNYLPHLADIRVEESIGEIVALYALHEGTRHAMPTVPVDAQPTVTPVVPVNVLTEAGAQIVNQFATVGMPAANFAVNDSVVDDVHGLEFFDFAELHGGRFKPHQAEGIAMMVVQPRTMCGDPVGAGKTIQAAGLIAHCVGTGKIDTGRPALWLTEGNQVAYQTMLELQRFLPRLTIQNLAGHRDLTSRRNEKRCRRALDEPAHVKVMSYSQWRTRGHLWTSGFPLVILDEVSSLKGGGKNYDAVLAATQNAGRVHAFTATIYENNPVEVWHVYSLLDIPGMPTLTQFEDEFVDWRHAGRERKPYAWRSRDMAHRFRDLTAEHYFDRPGCVADLNRPDYSGPQYAWVPLSAAQQQAMAAITQRRGVKRLTAQEAVVTGRQGPVSTRAGRAADIIGQVVDRDPTAKVLLIAEAIPELDALADFLKAAGIGFVKVRGDTDKAVRSDVVVDFRTDPNLHVLLGSKVVERGLNLQFCRYLISVGLPDNPARLTQAVGRIVRHGSPFDRVEHWVVLNDHDVDHQAVERLQRKTEQAAYLYSQLR